jgi:DNA-binding XRE family transcriptional regulator
MRMADRVANLQRARRIARPGERAAELRERSQASKARIAERIAQERARLTPEDQVVAQMTRLPRERADRVALAKELRVTASGRKRSQREVAAIMGLTASAIKHYEGNPDKHPDHQKPHNRPPKLPPRVLTSRGAPEPQAPFGRALQRKRKRVGVTQAALATETGVSKERISEIERGETPTVEEAVTLNAGLNKLC